MSSSSRGFQFRSALAQEQPLQIVGTINAYSAILAKQVGYKAIYLSGGGVACASYGLPDLGVTNLNDVLEDARRITQACDLPLLVDIDTGWGDVLNVNRTIKSMIQAGVAAVHMEDQFIEKRCGHRPGKKLISKGEMADKIKAAVDARTDPHFVIIARTDALAGEGLESAISRCQAYIDAGADMIFAEAVTQIEQYQKFVDELKVPILANITEFGKTPLFTLQELKSVGIAMALYPLSAFRAMSAAAKNIYQVIRQTGTQQSVLDKMQTREELYQAIDYHRYEEMLDKLFEIKE
ncbi:MAG: methylisocitrate lyase [Pseudomonadota bacterium]